MPTSNKEAEAWLAHYGVLGMKWGRHLPGRTEPSHNPRVGRRIEAHPDHAEAHTLKRNPTKSLSTAEIKKINDRLQTEKKYRELNPKGVDKGKAIVTATLATTALGVAVYSQLNSKAGKAGIKAGKAAVEAFKNRYASEIGKIIWKSIK